MKKILFCILLLLAIPLTTAATIHGAVYDLALEPQEDLIIEVDSTPLQRQVTKDGTYSFQLPAGVYTLTVTNAADEMVAREQIEINEQGDYIVDIFTLLELEEFEQVIDDTTEEITLNTNKEDNLPIIILAAILLVAVGIYFFKKKGPQEVESLKDPLKEKVLKVLKKNGNRITQKELRKKFPFSEAKMSLVITELEQEKKIKKIKKGRSNVLILL